MLVPLSWMLSFAPLPTDVDLLRATFDDLGLVVESVERIGEGLDQIVCARVTDISAIDGADKVRKITVDAGGAPLTIVCGAWNFSVGDVVPLAPVGAVLPGDFVIAKRKMRGVESNGMLCSARELGLGGDHAGLMLLTTVEGATPGAPVADVLGITPDVIFELSAEGNRPDAWSILGVVRDLAARLGVPVTVPALTDASIATAAATSPGAASIAAPAFCQRLTVTAATGIVVTDSPRFIVDRLEACGMRAINNVVDASNYVMLELGQPTHAYDAHRLSGGTLGVRLATPEETITTLDDVERVLGVPGRGLGDSGEDVVIVDGDDVVIGIAGVMGGASTEIHDGTTALVLEAASFSPMAIARTSKKLGLRSEASSRFERGVDPNLAGAATERFFQVLRLTCPLLAVGWPSAVAEGDVAPVTVITASVGEFTRLLGLGLDAATVERLLAPLGFAVAGDAILSITVPSNRPDIRTMPFGVADVAEEIVRTYGYTKLERTFPSWSTPGSLSGAQRRRRNLRSVLCGLGLDEVWTPTLVDPVVAARGLGDEAIVRLTNPLSAEEGALRTSLLPQMLAAIAYNADRRQLETGFFELGTVFEHPAVAVTPRTTKAGGGGGAVASLPMERTHLLATLGRHGDDAATAVAMFAELHPTLGLGPYRLVQPAPLTDLGPLGLGLHPTRSAAVVCVATGITYGVVGEVDPTVVALAGVHDGRRIGLLGLDVDALAAGELARAVGEAIPVSKFPSSEIDLAFVLADATPADALRAALVAAAGEHLSSCVLFDVYRGTGVADGSRSLAFRLQFGALDRTLTDGDVGAWRTSCIDAAASLGAVLR